MKNLHRTFAFLWKERYTCGVRKTVEMLSKKNNILENSFLWENFEKIYTQ